MKTKANWLTVKNAKPVRSNMRSHDDRQTGVTGSRRFQFKSRKPLRAVSKRMIVFRQRYNIEARAFVKAAKQRGQTCPVMAEFDNLPAEMQQVLCTPGLSKRSSSELTEVHHRRGRVGELLMDKRHWLAVSHMGHIAIGMFPAEARRRGWLCAEGLWNVPDKEDK